MLSINDLKSGSLILIEKAPYQVLEVAHLHMGRGGSSVQTKIKNIKTGQVLSRNFKPADTFKEADVEKRPLKFLYTHRGEFVFVDLPKPPEGGRDPGPEGLGTKKPNERFSVSEETVGDNKKWLKPNTELVALFLDEKPINIQLPIKMDFEVTEAPPGIQGDRSSSGTKTATLETGAVVQVPLFINTGDVIRINTETGEYVERVEKT